MNLRFWYKSLVQLCIGMAIGCVGVLIYTGKWALLPGWVSALFWAIGWRIEIATSDNYEKEANYWKNLWISDKKKNYEKAVGKPRYVTQKELDERKKRIMEYDFSPNEDKEN